MPSKLRLLSLLLLLGVLRPGGALAVDTAGTPDPTIRIEIARPGDSGPQVNSGLDYCLQDKTSGAVLSFGSTTAQYVVGGLNGNFFEQGVGVVSTVGSVTTFSHTLREKSFNGFETVHATVNTATNQGQASVYSSDENHATFPLFSISASNVTTNTGCATLVPLTAPVEGVVNYTGTGLTHLLGGQTNINDYTVLQRYSLNSDFTGHLTRLSYVIARNNGPGDLSYQYVVHSDNNGTPGPLIYQSPTINSTFAGLPTFYLVQDLVDLPSYKTYWTGLRWNPSISSLLVPYELNPDSPKTDVCVSVAGGTCELLTSNPTFSGVRNIWASVDYKYPTQYESTGLVRFGNGQSSNIISCKSRCSYTQIAAQPNLLASLYAENGSGGSFPPKDFSNAFARIRYLDVPNVIGIDGFAEAKFGTTKYSAYSYSTALDLNVCTKFEGVTDYVCRPVSGYQAGTCNYTRLAGITGSFELSCANGPSDQINRWSFQPNTSGWTSTALNPITSVYGPDFGGPWYKTASFGTTVSYEYQAKSGAILNQWFSGNTSLGTLTLDTDTLGSGPTAATQMGGDCNRDGICTFGRYQRRTGDNVADYIDFTQSPARAAIWPLGPSVQGFGFGRSASVSKSTAFYASYTPSATPGQFKLQTDYYNFDTRLKYTFSYDFAAGGSLFPLSFARADGDWSLSTSKGLNIYTSLTAGCGPDRIGSRAPGGTTPTDGGAPPPCENIPPISGRAGASSGGGLLTPAAFAGNWSGNWHNMTYGTTGPVTLDASTNSTAHTYSATLTLGGEVFGGSPPPAQTFGGSTVSSNGTYGFTSPAFGAVTFTFGSGGTLSGSATGIPNPNISRIDFSGTINATMISLDYSITGAITANGNVVLSKD